MSGILLLSATFVAIPVAVRLVMALLDRKRPQPQKPITGKINGVTVESPHYTDTNRVGSRIDFDVYLSAHETIKLESAVAYVSGNDHKAYERPLFRPSIFPHVVRKGNNLVFSGSVYVDDVKPEDINKDTFAIEFTDSTGVKYFI
jgi:hypothetical protein